MRVLLDTNIIIYREATRVFRQDIGGLFYWLDRIKSEKCIHPLSIQEIRKHQDPAIVNLFETKLNSYNVLKTQAPDTPEITRLRQTDKTENDRNDTSLLAEVFSDRVDLLITEDRHMHEKARILRLSTRVFTIDAFLEKVVAENPELVDYEVLAVRQEYFGNINIEDLFFDSFKQDYAGFEIWFKRKSDEIAYICRGDDQDILAFLYVKVENKDENYGDIEPIFLPKKRLKIGTFKVTANGYKLGERFLKIVFDNALQYSVDEIYVTIFNNTEEQKRLISLLEDWGFIQHGTKAGKELVYVRNFTPKVDIANPNLTYPYFSGRTRKFIVPIKPDYHTELLPDSILRTENPKDFIDNRPNRNAISKVYVSRSIERGLHSGDVVVFYRTKDEGAGYYKSVTTSVGVVQNVVTKIKDADHFIQLCRKRSVFDDQKLTEIWGENEKYRPFVVNFLYTYSLPRRLILRDLMAENIIKSAPRGFEPLSDAAFKRLMERSNADQRLIVD